MTVWQRFEDPVWRKQAEQRQHPNVGGTWQVEKTDNKKVRQHKLRVKDWLFKSNLTEDLLLNHPSPDDVKFLQELQTNSLWDYFSPSDIAMIGSVSNMVVLKRRSLTEKQITKIEHAVIKAQRLYQRQIKRIGILNGKEAYANYKTQISNI